MPKNFKLKKPRTVVTIERRNGKLVRVTTVWVRKARDRYETVEPYNPLTIGPVASIWEQREQVKKEST